MIIIKLILFLVISLLSSSCLKPLHYTKDICYSNILPKVQIQKSDNYDEEILIKAIKEKIYKDSTDVVDPKYLLSIDLSKVRNVSVIGSLGESTRFNLSINLNYSIDRIDGKRVDSKSNKLFGSIIAAQDRFARMVGDEEYYEFLTTELADSVVNDIIEILNREDEDCRK